MTRVPIPLLGVRGIRYLAREFESWPSTIGPRRAVLNLGWVIRMQEEIGREGRDSASSMRPSPGSRAALLGNDRYLELSGA